MTRKCSTIGQYRRTIVSVATWKDVARIVAELPETTEASPRNWRVRKKLMVWERPLRKADYAALGDAAPDGDILGARVSDEGSSSR